MSITSKIGTHDGKFHCDEVFACYMLKTLPENKNAEIVRSRDPQQLSVCDIVVDVGGVYDPSKQRYDHHQPSFQVSMSSVRPDLLSTVRFSSAGLVYHHFGESVLQAVAGQTLEKTLLKKLFKYVYFNFVQEIDAIDNGVSICEVGKQVYTITTHLSNRVGRLNEYKNETSSVEEQFEKAMVLVGEEFKYCVNSFISQWADRLLVEAAFSNRFKVHASGEILDMPSCHWKDHLHEIEVENDLKGLVKFIIFDAEKLDTWKVAAVPKALPQEDFENRVPLAWKGLRDDELQKASGVKDGIFVHATGFMGQAGSKEGALLMAIKSLELWKTQLMTM